MPKNKLSKAKSIQRTKTFVDLILSAAVVFVCGSVVKGAYDRTETVGSTEFAVKEEVETPTEPSEEEKNEMKYSTFVADTKDKFYGDLILVNNDHQYFTSGDEDLVSIMEMNDETGRDFNVVDYSYTILRPVYEPMAEMITDFYNKYYNDTLIIFGSYRTNDFQQELYEADLADKGSEDSTRVAKPGFSEHETGYAFDFSETESYDFQDEGDFKWFGENCYKYGFVVRYPKSKEKITDIQYEPWHFRYVGKPHAYYMTKNNLCLEEYIDVIRSNPYDSTHLEFTDDNGENYEVYFYPSDDSSETTAIPVPTDKKYEISGNNVDGFIVTVYKDREKSAEPSTEAPTKSADDEGESEETEESEENEDSEDYSEDE